MSLERRSSTIEWPEINFDEWLDKCPENDADSTFDESDIEAIASLRTKQMEPELLKTYKIAVDRYSEIGLPQDMMNKKLQQFDEYLAECLAIISNVVDGEYNKFVDYKEGLLVKIRKMRKDLYLPAVDDNENYPLVQLCKRLRRKFVELNTVKEKRMTRLKELRDKQIQHCLVLGIKTPELKFQTDIPTQEELDALAKAVLDLAHEESHRKKKYSTLMETISKCMDQIDYAPRNEFEANISSAKPNYSEDYLSKLSGFHSTLEQQCAANQAKYEQLKSRLESLYHRLDIEQEIRQDFFDTHSVCKPKIMAEMEAEIEIREEEKRQNIGTFIEKIKDELIEEYERCYISDDARQKFLSLITPDDCNEELLDLCENELRRMKDYYETNKMIIEKVSKWKEHWAHLIALEENACNPNRLYNRGGNLLQEAKQRTRLQRELPKIEKELCQMNKEFQFKIYDTDLDKFIKGCWDELSTAKEVEKLERQKAKQNPVQSKKAIPAKRACGPGTTPTPSKLQKTILGTPNRSTNSRSNYVPASVKKNIRSNIPVAGNGPTTIGKSIANSDGSESCGKLSISGPEFDELAANRPTSARRYD